MCVNLESLPCGTRLGPLLRQGHHYGQDFVCVRCGHELGATPDPLDNQADDPTLGESGAHAALRRAQSATPTGIEVEDALRRAFICEEKLLDLALGLNPDLETIGILARMLVWTARNTAHIIAINDELPWRKLQAAMGGDRLPSIYLRCLRCGVRAHIYLWATAATPYPLDKALLPPQIQKIKNLEGDGYLRPCNGAHMARELLRMTDPRYREGNMP